MTTHSPNKRDSDQICILPLQHPLAAKPAAFRTQRRTKPPSVVSVLPAEETQSSLVQQLGSAVTSDDPVLFSERPNPVY